MAYIEINNLQFLRLTQSKILGFCEEFGYPWILKNIIGRVNNKLYRNVPKNGANLTNIQFVYLDSLTNVLVFLFQLL